MRVDVPPTLIVTSRDEKVDCRAFVADCRARWNASVRLVMCRPQSSAGRVVCRCLEWPQAVSGFLKSAATLTKRSGEGASCSGLRATSSKHAPRDCEPT